MAEHDRAGGDVTGSAFSGRGLAGSAAGPDLAVAVVGLGYVGLPLAVAYAEAGFDVAGFDVDDERVAALDRGHSHVPDVGTERLAAAVDAGRFRATAEHGDLRGSDVVFICVPTPFDRAKTPDLSAVETACEQLREVLAPGMLVILQSTTYPGTTREVVLPALERGGLRAGVDFLLAFSPERVDPGNRRWTVANTPKVVGGLTPACADRARAVLEAVMDEAGRVRVVESLESAEMSKLLENTYRAVNIALVNEMAVLSREMGIDIWEVVGAAATKPFGFEAFSPGVGPGGHCIPVDPYYLAWKAREFDFQSKFIELAADTNLRMVKYVLGRILDFMNRVGRTLRGSRVLCLGAAFKDGVSDTRNSRAVRLMELLGDAGARVEYADPLVPELSLRAGHRKAVPFDEISWGGFDLVTVLVGRPPVPLDTLRELDVPVFDTTNALGRPAHPLHERL